MQRKGSFAHLEPSETYIKAFYKLKELEVALVSACLTTDQVNTAEKCAIGMVVLNVEGVSSTFRHKPNIILQVQIYVVRSMAGTSGVGRIGGGIISNGTRLPTLCLTGFLFYLCAAACPNEQLLKLARLLENFPREGQIRAEVVVAFYHKVCTYSAPEHR